MSGLQYDFEQARFTLVETVEPSGALGERRNCADERANVDFFSLHEVEDNGIFAGYRAGSVQGDLARDNGLEWQLDCRAYVADEGDRSAFAHQVDGHADRGRDSDGGRFRSAWPSTWCAKA